LDGTKSVKQWVATLVAKGKLLLPLKIFTVIISSYG
jgi:hypothetical protein